MDVKSNLLRRGMATAAVLGIAAAGVLSTAGSASAATYDDGHYDLVFKPTCNILGAVNGGSFEIEGVGSDPSPVFEFGGATDPDLGFEVEWPASGCIKSSVTVRLVGATGASGEAGPSSGTPNYDWKPASSQAPLVLSSPLWHADPDEWRPTGGSSALTFRFDPGYGSDQTSTEVLTVTN